VAHTHYKGTGQMHSFRGILADGGQDKIRIEGAMGEIAWRITKFQIMQEKPGNSDVEFVLMVWREEQTTVVSEIDFNNAELLAAGFITGSASYNNPESVPNIVFDNDLFARNIWVTSKDLNTGESCNYYIELEEVKVGAAGMAQLAVAAARRN